MNPVIEQIVYDIQAAPSTFINIASTTDCFLEVFGPHALGKMDDIPRYGFSDDIIQNAPSNDNQIVNSRYVHYCGSLFAMDLKVEDGAKALPLMMRLARSGLIAPSNYTESMDLTAWSATSQAGKEMIGILRETGLYKYCIAEKIGKLLRPNSSLDAARSLCERIEQNYR